MVARNEIFLMAVILEDTVCTLLVKHGIGDEPFLPYFLSGHGQQISPKPIRPRSIQIPGVFLILSPPEATLLQEFTGRPFRIIQNAFDVQTEDEYQELQKEVESRHHHYDGEEGI